MNNLEIVEGGRYKIQAASDEYIDDLYVIRKVKIRRAFGFVTEGIVYSNFGDGSFKQIMTERKFRKVALYRDNDPSLSGETNKNAL